MILKSGYNKSIPTPNISNQNQDISAQLSDVKNQTVVARVKDIVLDENHPKFNDVGGYNGIGTIYYEISNSTGTNLGTLKAKPVDPHSKTYPLINELVILYNLPNQNIGIDTSSTSYYYLTPVNLWNHPHHDAYPNPITTSTLPSSQQQDYQQTAGGSVRRVSDSSTEIELNSPINPSQNTFVEKTNIHPILPFMGDTIFEGRYGQSLRFGSTAKSNSPINNSWSSTGDNGDPITILRNGQPSNADDKGWVPVVEDINKDLSSIYLTSTQKLINFSLAREEKGKWKTYPTTPSEYISPQTILNSDRIIINAKNDSVLIGAKKSIGLTCYDELNLTANNTILDSTNLYLGSKNATEPALLGDKTVTTLRQITSLLKSITSVLQLDQMYPGGIPVPNGPLNTVSLTSNQIFAQIEASLDNLTSKKVKVE